MSHQLIGNIGMCQNRNMAFIMFKSCPLFGGSILPLLGMLIKKCKQSYVTFLSLKNEDRICPLFFKYMHLKTASCAGTWGPTHIISHLTSLFLHTGSQTSKSQQDAEMLCLLKKYKVYLSEKRGGV